MSPTVKQLMYEIEVVIIYMLWRVRAAKSRFSHTGEAWQKTTLHYKLPLCVQPAAMY